jgi:hypothetical protein
MAAQDLWITGSAVPGGAQKLEKVADNDYKYAGRLNAGELRVATAKKPRKGTSFFSPVLMDANLVNKGIAYCETTDAKAPAWQVVVSEDRYRLHVYTDRKELRGEIFQPWGELFIAGGATEAGWKEGKMLLMKQDLNNPCLWTWEGELKRHPEVEEPTSFKFQGQDRWYPKNLHPYRQGTDVLQDRRLRTGGDDTKWEISRDGRYRITVDLFHETIQADIVK